MNAQTGLLGVERERIDREREAVKKHLRERWENSQPKLVCVDSDIVAFDENSRIAEHSETFVNEGGRIHFVNILYPDEIVDSAEPKFIAMWHHGEKMRFDFSVNIDVDPPTEYLKIFYKDEIDGEGALKLAFDAGWITNTVVTPYRYRPKGDNKSRPIEEVLERISAQA